MMRQHTAGQETAEKVNCPITFGLQNADSVEKRRIVLHSPTQYGFKYQKIIEADSLHFNLVVIVLFPIHCAGVHCQNN
uniref:Uncharacterized protein n=1 Tax=Anguilla anguilla TaxID=7936 RepID=A0A0E9R880_ANGAN